MACNTVACWSESRPDRCSRNPVSVSCFAISVVPGAYDGIDDFAQVDVARQFHYDSRLAVFGG